MRILSCKKIMCELFAGVGGFRLGLERLDSGWKTVWFSQWEPEKRNSGHMLVMNAILGSARIWMAIRKHPVRI